MAPTLKKAIAYKRDRRFVAEHPHRERRSWPKRKALRHQQYRRGVDRAIRPALGTVTPEIDDFAPVLPRRKTSKQTFRHGNRRSRQPRCRPGNVSAATSSRVGEALGLGP